MKPFISTFITLLLLFSLVVSVHSEGDLFTNLIMLARFLSLYYERLRFYSPSFCLRKEAKSYAFIGSKKHVEETYFAFVEQEDLSIKCPP